jgi:tRNA threonylcarbamoyladenosine biosynthesis protein TsaE
MELENLTKSLSIDCVDEAASKNLACQLAQCIKPSLIITFSGDIGAGKTTMIRAMLSHLGLQGPIKSPTFSLVESYDVGPLQIHHFDLYRIQHEEELNYLGFRDYFTTQSICVIEWAEHAGNTLPKVDIRFKLQIKGEGRLVHIDAKTYLGERILTCLSKEQ